MIYLDNAATTPTKPEVVEAMLPYFSEKFGNPSSLYTIGNESKQAIEKARETIASSIGAKPEEIYFTSGGTEADNWALIATAEAYKDKGKHIITSKIEHHAVLKACEYLESKGFEVSYINVDKRGTVKIDELEAAIRPDTILISIMTANNEIGTIQPIDTIGTIAKRHNILFHTDAVQAYCQIPVNVDKSHIDMMSTSAHKLGGSKGVGFLYIRNGMKTGSFIHGGDQESKRRAGTENVPGIIGYAKAVEIATQDLQKKMARETLIRNCLIDLICSEIPYVHVNGHKIHRLPNNVNITIDFVEGESVLMMLDEVGIIASSGSACTSSSNEPSHVLKAIGLTDEQTSSSIRLTLGDNNTLEEMGVVVKELKNIVDILRDISPSYQKLNKSQP